MIRALLSSTLPALVLAGCAVVNVSEDTIIETPRYDTSTEPISAAVVGVTGDEIGSVKLTQGPIGVLGEVVLEAGAVTSGWHGLHIHQVGDCSDVGRFTNSGSHLGLVPNGHGLLNPVGPEAGDLPNFYASADGSGAIEFFTTITSLDEIRDADGPALILHQNRDDHITQPIGGAGPRVGCAVLN